MIFEGIRILYRQTVGSGALERGLYSPSSCPWPSLGRGKARTLNPPLRSLHPQPYQRALSFQSHPETLQRKLLVQGGVQIVTVQEAIFQLALVAVHHFLVAYAWILQQLEEMIACLLWNLPAGVCREGFLGGGRGQSTWLALVIDYLYSSCIPWLKFSLGDYFQSSSDILSLYFLFWNSVIKSISLVFHTPSSLLSDSFSGLCELALPNLHGSEEKNRKKKWG